MCECIRRLNQRIIATKVCSWKATKNCSRDVWIAKLCFIKAYGEWMWGVEDEGMNRRVRERYIYSEPRSRREIWK